MNLDTDRQATNTQRKLDQIEAQIVRARARPDTPENRESLESLVRMAKQLREEIVRFCVR